MRARTAVVLAGLLAAVGLAPAGARGGDLGVRGTLFPILEPDLIDYLRSKLEQAKASGKVEKLNRDFEARSRQTIEHPSPVAGLTTTSEAKSWLFDPSMVVQADISDTRGHVFAHKGDVINPLQHLSNYDRVLVFIDGDDPRQVQYASAEVRKFGPERTKAILVKGSPLELMRAERTQFFFDQMGALTKKFGFHHVPAEIVREGDNLRISEVLP
jgi:conjugal transfer pilus assembly protein TraW